METPRVLMKDGVWLVPPGERPSNWQSLPIRDNEPPSDDTPTILEQVIEETKTSRPELALCGCGKPKKHNGYCSTRFRIGIATRKRRQHFEQIASAIADSAREMRADQELCRCLKVLLAGLWTRDVVNLRKLTGVLTPAPIMQRYIDAGIWLDDRVVVLGHGEDDLTLWLLAMVGAGQIRYCGQNEAGEPLFCAISSTLPLPRHPLRGGTRPGRIDGKRKPTE